MDLDVTKNNCASIAPTQIPEFVKPVFTKNKHKSYRTKCNLERTFIA